MHPIERLRFVARAEGAPQSTLVSEAARALTAFANDPAGMVMAVQRLISHHPEMGSMWWLGARVLSSTDGAQEAFTASEELEDDDTTRQLLRHLDPEATVVIAGWPPAVVSALAKRGSGRVLVLDTDREASGAHRTLDHRGVDAYLVPMTGIAAAVAAADVVVIEVEAGGPDAALFGPASGALAALGRAHDVAVIAAVGVGRLLPTRLWDALVQRWEQLDEPWELAEDLVPWSLVDEVVGPDGSVAVERVQTLITAPVVPELLRIP